MFSRIEYERGKDMDVLVIFIIHNENDTYDVWVNGREICEARELGIQAASDRARAILRNHGGGVILFEDEKGNHLETEYVKVD